ncbi:MAG: NAD-dependent DNA ligase LigA, partial [Pseudomonadota bacterium]
MKDVTGLTESEAAEELAHLAQEIARHDALYHAQDDPEISDADYDALRRRNLAIEQRFPALIREDSPSKRVGYVALEKFEKHKHALPMLSLKNAFSDEDVKEFAVRIRRFLKLQLDEPVILTSEPKIDGLSLSLRYEAGRLVSAATRGDGAVGENVTENALTIADIPGVLACKNPPDVVEVRGEVYMTHAAFRTLNTQMEAEGKPAYVTPRNTAAGSLRQLDSAVTASRPLRFFAYAWGEMSDMPRSSQFEMVEWLAACGFKTNPLMRRHGDIDDVIAHYRHIEKVRPELEYDIDGVVYKVDNVSFQTRLGLASSYPQWAIAHKFPAEKAWTILRDIEIQVGRTGTLTPVARLEPVTVGGVVVTNATLHNEDFIRGKGNKGEVLRNGKDLRIGDHVMLQRAGDVIPQILDVDIEKRSSTSSEYKFLRICPCNLKTPVVREVTKTTGSSVAQRCSGGYSCPYQKIEQFSHFVSRKAFNIEGLGEKQIEYILGTREIEVNYPVDLFFLENSQKHSAFQLVEQEGFGKVSVENLYRSIARSKSIEFHRFLYALGIRRIGEQTSKAYAHHFNDPTAFMEKFVQVEHSIKKLWTNELAANAN